MPMIPNPSEAPLHQQGEEGINFVGIILFYWCRAIFAFLCWVNTRRKERKFTMSGESMLNYSAGRFFVLLVVLINSLFIALGGFGLVINYDWLLRINCINLCWFVFSQLDWTLLWCSVTCILRWATYKNEPTCPQCKHPFEFLHIHRSLDGR